MKKLISTLVLFILLLECAIPASADAVINSIGDNEAIQVEPIDSEPVTVEAAVEDFTNKPVVSNITELQPPQFVGEGVTGAVYGVDSVTSVVYGVGSVTSAVYGKDSVTGAVYDKKSSLKSTAMTMQSNAYGGYIPDPSVTSSLKSMNMKSETAPFAVNNGDESISTMNGNLSTSATDLTLPGVNGFSFTLSRTYDVSNSFLYEKEVEPVIGCRCILKFKGTTYTEYKR
ncbi:hypothetical protein, partial [Paenibacillus kobensis]|uniref:hypothetical protein n=1 Tax=Paenibacillus kobensis TaxID=59841 RepID=UPI0013E38389